MASRAPAFRFVAWLALACHVLVASGLPVPLSPAIRDRAGAAHGAPKKERSRPFPCMDKPCGCATAEQCFAACCCHTPAQRLAWAKAHGVEPAVLAALERRVAGPPEPPTGCCAAAPEERSCRAGAAEDPLDPEAPEVCGDYRSLAAEPAPREPAPEHAAARVVILRDMLACGGIVSAWLACGTALPPPRVVPPGHDAPAGTVAVADVIAPSVSADRTTPPPRVG